MRFSLDSDLPTCPVPSWRAHNSRKPDSHQPVTPARLVLRSHVAPVDRTSQGGDLMTLCLPLQAWAGLLGRPSSSSILFLSVGSYLVPAPTQDSSAPAQVCLDLILTAALLTVTDVCLCVVWLLSGFGSSGFPGVVWPEPAYLGCLPPSLMQCSLQDGCHLFPFSTYGTDSLLNLFSSGSYPPSSRQVLAPPLSSHSFSYILLEWFLSHSVFVCCLVPCYPCKSGSSSREETVHHSSGSPWCVLRVGHIKDPQILLRRLACCLEQQCFLCLLMHWLGWLLPTETWGWEEDSGILRLRRCGFSSRKCWTNHFSGMQWPLVEMKGFP